MGVYIDMEMPKSCAKCKLLGEYGCPFIGSVGYAYTEGRRNERCPLTPVPAHGRLIDADALLMRISHEVMEAYMDGACYGVHPSQEYLYLLGEIIEDAPTIIPAEDGE